MTVRGEDYVAVLDGQTFEEKTRIQVPNGPGMQIFSPDGEYGYVCSSFTPETVVISVADQRIVGHVKQDSPFCPNIAAKALLRKAAERTVDGLWNAIGQLLDLFPPAECANYLANAGYPRSA